MNRKILLSAATIGLALGLSTQTADAAPPTGAGEGGKPVGIACQQFGHGVLRATGVLPSVARDGLAFPIGSDNVFSLDEVLAIHRTDPATANVVLKAYAEVLLPGQDVDAAIDAACPA